MTSEDVVSSIEELKASIRSLGESFDLVVPTLESLFGDPRLEYLSKPVSEMGVHTRVWTRLSGNGMETVFDVVIKSEQDIAKIDHIGPKGLRQLKEVLAEADLELGMNIRKVMTPKYTIL